MTKELEEAQRRELRARAGLWDALAKAVEALVEMARKAADRS